MTCYAHIVNSVKTTFFKKKKKTNNKTMTKKPQPKPQTIIKHKNSSGSWQINLFRAKTLLICNSLPVLKSRCVTSLLPSVYMCVVVYFKECCILSACFLTASLIFHKSCLSLLFFIFSSCNFDGNTLRCCGYINYCVLVLFHLFTLFLVWNLSLQILLLLLKAASSQIKLYSKIRWSLIIAVPNK